VALFKPLLSKSKEHQSSFCQAQHIYNANSLAKSNELRLFGQVLMSNKTTFFVSS